MPLKDRGRAHSFKVKSLTFSNDTRPLIIDVGAHNGDDTAYYLNCGYRVVSVEANPVLADELRQRFRDFPVCVENVCVGQADSETVTFWVNQVNSTWSSFERAVAAREGTEAIPVEVPSVQMGTLLKRYGVPHYLKIDIEGMDEECLRSVDPANAPKYISLEVSHSGDIIGGLQALGYTHFKLVNQATFTTAVPIFPRELGWRFLRKARLGFLVPDGIKHDFDVFQTKHGWDFREGCSGPFGPKTFGPWLTADQAKRLHERIQRAFLRGGWTLSHCWYDVHATV
jgi:FkbM family methyltransferase